MKPYQKVMIKKDGARVVKWLVKYYWKGTGHYSKPFDTLAEAQTFCDNTALDLKAAKRSDAVPHCIQIAKKPIFDSGIRPVTADKFIELCMEFKSPDLAPASVKKYRNSFKALRNLVPFRHIGEVTPAMIQTFKAKSKAQGLAPSTIANRIITLRVLFNWAVTQKYISESPCPAKMKRDPDSVGNDPKVYLTIPEMEHLSATAAQYGEDIHWFVLLCGFAGLRFNEALNAKWEWFNVTAGFLQDGGSITVQSGFKFKPKSRQARTISLHRRIKTHFDFVEGHGKTGYLIKPDVLEWNHYRWNNHHLFLTVLKAAGLEFVDRGNGLKKVGPHTLRHSFASALAQSGHTTYQIMQLCGHSDEKVSQGYMHLAPHTQSLTFGTGDPKARKNI